MSTKSKIVFSVLLTFTITCLVFTSMFRVMGIGVGTSGRFQTVIGIINRNYIGDYDREAAENAAIDAYVSSIGDPYSVYYDSDSAQTLRNSVNGNYVGIGIEIFANPETKELVVLSAYNKSPARKAGIRSGDIIVAIDGKEYNSESLDEAVIYMKGMDLKDPVGTSLTVTVRRDDALLDLPMTREVVDLYTIECDTVGENLLYIKYPGFSAESAKELKSIISEANEYSGIILDLRENPGGDLDASIDICDIFLSDGLIMYTEDKNGRRDEYYATKEACTLPLAILVDGGSASASEIVAGCLQARGRAVIIGEKTYGKGVSQILYSLGPKDDSPIIRVTGYKNYRPDGIWLNEAVTPDIEAINNLSLDEYGSIVFDANGDLPLNRAIEELSK